MAIPTAAAANAYAALARMGTDTANIATAVSARRRARRPEFQLRPQERHR